LVDSRICFKPTFTIKKRGFCWLMALFLLGAALRCSKIHGNRHTNLDFWVG